MALISFLTWIHAGKINGQNLKKMTPSVYSEWNRIKNVKLSDSAETITYMLDREIGDNRLLIYNREKQITHSFERIIKAEMEINGRNVIFSNGLSYDSTRALKVKKTPKDKMPSDSLTIFNAKTMEKTTINSIKDFVVPTKYSGYCFYTKLLNNVSESDTTAKGVKKTTPICEPLALVVRNLNTGVEDTIRQIKEYVIAEKYPALAYTQCAGDSTAKLNVFVKYLIDGTVELIDTGFVEAINLSLSQNGEKIAFLGLKEKSKAQQKPYQLYLKKKADTNVHLISENFWPKEHNMFLSPDKKITWSESGNRMIFGVAPPYLFRDTTKLDEDIVNVEIWHHDSPKLYTQMETTFETDKKKSFLCVYDTGTSTFHQIENDDTDHSILSQKGDGKYALLTRAKPYQKAITWNGESLIDLFLYDFDSKGTTLISTGESGNPKFSPAGRYLFWWSRPDSIWKTYDTQRSTLGYLGLWSISKFHDEQNDQPQLADGYGLAGWLKDDSAAIVYDRYDLWKLNPLDAFSYTNLTNGRSEKNVYRWIRTDDEIEYIDTSTLMLLHKYNERTRNETYVWLDYKTGQLANNLSGEFSLTKNVIKARKNNLYVFTKENFSIFPDLLLSDQNFTIHEKISDANPQQKEYAWGSVKLFTWTNYRGQMNEGMLFFPPDFDPEKKYPLLVNFYERSSETIFRHRAPEAHRSTINYTYYTNLGYIIFNPDIHYNQGQPGDDCVNAVESGVDALIKLGYVDTSRMGLQGHSWGGYQVAYLLTKSGRYACAESGAPVVNMVSAYGGIRWESGMSRMFQYEKTQSRLGATLWDNPSLYHKNSPIYEMTNVKTPVLILHNDQDGAVPWYQGIEYFMALRRLGKPAWLLNYNNEPHWPLKWPNRLDFNIRMEQFFNHYLMNGPKPAWMIEGNTPLEKGILNKY